MLDNRKKPFGGSNLQKDTLAIRGALQSELRSCFLKELPGIALLAVSLPAELIFKYAALNIQATLDPPEPHSTAQPLVAKPKAVPS